MIQVNETELDDCIGRLDEVCSSRDFEILRLRIIRLLDIGIDC